MGERKTVVVGVGNPILSDDVVGLAVARLVHERVAGEHDVELTEAAVGGFELVEMLVGYDRAVIIDAIQTEGGCAGDCHLVDLKGLAPTDPPAMTHQIGLVEGLELARRLGMKIPTYLRVYAVEVADPYTFGTEMTEQVKAAVPRIAERIVSAEFSGVSWS